ncbi:MAG: hypothetical protein L3K13_07235 [Thermoplasmata archaeon]|nr:hypothetical protein [Thermoplasmata archaeon]
MLRNDGGMDRAARVFLLYVGFLLVLFVIFTGAQLASPYPGVRDNLLGTAALALIALLAAAGGFAITMGRAPRALRAERGAVVILEWWGRERRLPVGPASSPTSVKGHPPFLFGTGWTETVELTWPGGARRVYLLERGLLARAVLASEPVD